MHNKDKVGASTIGQLILMNTKFAINPFPEGKDLTNKEHKLATHFSYGSDWYKHLWNIADALYGAHGQWVKICMDLNTTWIFACQFLLYPIWYKTIGLKSYTMSGNTHGAEDWKAEE